MNMHTQCGPRAAAALAGAAITLALPLTCSAQISGDTYVSREYSLYVGPPGHVVGHATTREISLFVNDRGGHAFTRELSLFFGDKPGHATAREVSFNFYVCTLGQVAPSITAQPVSRTVCCANQSGACSTSSALLSVNATTSGYTLFEWQVEALPGFFVPLVDGANGFPFGQIVVAGAGTSDCTIALNGVQRSLRAIAFRCVVANACDNVTSNPATLTICPADFNCDGVLDPDDLSDYIGCFFTPACTAADFNGDGFADPDDLSDYIGAFFGGC